MNPALLAALITQVAIPELVMWLRSLHSGGEPLTDEAVLAKLQVDAATGIKMGEDWLQAHPE